MSRQDELTEITLYLKKVCAGDISAEEPLAEAVYARMRYLARGVFSGGSPTDSMEPTALANEVLLELVRLRSVDWKDRVHFFRVAARMLRRRFIDHIRASRASKRSPEGGIVPLADEIIAPAAERFDEILFVDEALDRLSAFDPSLAEIVELVYFGGCTIQEVAAARQVSEKTVDRQLDLARRWMALNNPKVPCPQLAPKHASSK